MDAYFFTINMVCWRRQDEKQMVEEFLLSNSWRKTDDISSADVVFLFTCGLTQEKVKMAISEVSKTKEMLKKDAILIMGGCLPKIDSDSLENIFNGKVITPTDFSALNNLSNIKINIEDFIKSRKNEFCFSSGVSHDKPVQESKIRDTFTQGPDILRFSKSIFHKIKKMASLQTINSIFHWLKDRIFKRYNYWQFNMDKCFNIHIAKGCARDCSYCAIRFAIGPLKSRPLNDCIEEIETAVDSGNKMLHLYADCVGDYGLDIGTNLGELLEKISKINKDFFLWLCDIQPAQFLKYFKQIENLCKLKKIRALHIPIQSANARILKLMHRQIDIQELENKILRIKKYSIWFKYDIMIGFPGETEEEFEDTLRFLQKTKKSFCFVVCYSDRPNTLASQLPGKIPEDVMRRRLDKIKKMKEIIIIG